MKKLFYIVAFAAIATSCVTKKQYNDVLASEQKYYTEAQNAKKELNSQKASIDDLNAQVERLKSEIDALKKDTTQQSQNIYSLNEDIDKLNKLNSELKDKLGKSKSEEEVKLLLNDLQKLQDKLQAANTELDKQQKLAEAQQKELDEQSIKLKELTDILNKKDAQMRDLKNRVSQALVGFEGKGLSVTNKNGKVYVSLDEQLLFKSGKWDVDEKGVKAIENLAKLLAENSDIHVEIEGHTDNIPYNGTGQIIDNWDLSVKRATAIVRILLQNKGIDPSRITASGHAEFLPVDTANTAEARQKNRRTEIVLSPNLDEIVNLLTNE